MLQDVLKQCGTLPDITVICSSHDMANYTKILFLRLLDNLVDICQSADYVVVNGTRVRFSTYKGGEFKGKNLFELSCRPSPPGNEYFVDHHCFEIEYRDLLEAWIKYDE
jgi:hypothetical protein